MAYPRKPDAPKPPAPKRKSRPLPPKRDIGFDEQNTEDAAGGTYKKKPVPGGGGPKRTYTPEKD
tara:strand:+ start:453 stop:644 length:192 start_codon:yes stop_codon:yes gene_type:complete